MRIDLEKLYKREELSASPREDTEAIAKCNTADSSKAMCARRLIFA